MACEGLSRGPSEELSTAPDVSFPPRTPSKALEQKDWPTFLPLSLSLSTPLPTHRSSPCSHPSPPPFLTQPPLLLCGLPAAVVRPESPAWMGLHTCVHTHHEQHTSLSLSLPPSASLPPPASLHSSHSLAFTCFCAVYTFISPPPSFFHPFLPSSPKLFPFSPFSPFSAHFPQTHTHTHTDCFPLDCPSQRVCESQATAH